MNFHDSRIPQREDVVADKLNMIITYLKMNITTVCTFPNFQPNNIQRDILTNCFIIHPILNNESDLTSLHKDLLKKINRLSKILIQMIQERQRLRIHIDACPIYNEKDSPNKTMESQQLHIFEVATQEDVNGVSKKSRVHKVRIQAEHVNIMENWYSEHENNPYLDQNSLHVLMDSTSLSESQIRNWYVTTFTEVYRKRMNRIAFLNQSTNSHEGFLIKEENTDRMRFHKRF